MLDEGANIFFSTKDSSLKLMRFINENKLNDINLMMASSLSDNFEDLMKINIEKNKLNKLFDSQKMQSIFYFLPLIYYYFFSVENKSENEIFFMAYLDQLKMKTLDKSIRSFSIIDMECTDSSSFLSLKNAFQALKKEKC